MKSHRPAFFLGTVPVFRKGDTFTFVYNGIAYAKIFRGTGPDMALVKHQVVATLKEARNKSYG